ncbi:VIT domain-containing protein [Aquimarina sp. 2201CG5-10]|uniref:VIT domain-containing protein n=1 Tax=Aquimarina callyspongiae TaxID=3098150 RepID=UPI002AB5D30E|nr:VIT domain-containing protein [Aquimarina sp. 2201CG5-10]MDY8134112.1 VIT domain-containing protein [Aquimarina sp. 2201CG5-10]
MKNLYSFIVTTLYFFAAFSQDAPVLNVSNKPLGLSSLDIKVEVIGNIATTTYDMLFYNPTDAILEGELSFPLGEGQNVSRFALDVNGKLREAVVVEKELGRIAFEAVVRRRVDPALLEKGTGNNYKARIYPIPSKGHKRVVLAYEQELSFDDGAHYYNLPLQFKNRLENFTLEISVFDQKIKPLVEKGKISGLDFDDWKRNYTTKVSKKDYTPNKSISVKIPLALDSQKLVMSEDYFYVYKNIIPGKRLREKPDKIILYWDTSLSMKDRDIEKEIKFLDECFSYFKNVEVQLITFSNIRLSNTVFNIKESNWDQLKETIKQTVYDGGTSYNGIFKEINDSDIAMLFSDGIVSLSEFDVKSKNPFFVVNSLVKANHATLKNSTEVNNGRYVNLKTNSIKEALESVQYESFKFLGYESSSKDIEIYPFSATTISHDFSIAGKNFKKGENIKLNFGYKDEITKSVIINLDNKLDSDLNIKRIWGQKKLDHLEKNIEGNKDEITVLGKEYSLITEYTSLIVLENVMDYVRYQITPPDELLEEYNRILASKNKKEQEIVWSLQESSENEERMITQDFEIVEDETIAEEPALLRSPEPVLEEIVEVEEVEAVEDIEMDDEDTSLVSFAVIEQIPVFPGCEPYTTEDERKNCFSQNIRSIVSRNFNTQIGTDLGLPLGVQRIYAMFTIDRKGKVNNILVRAPHPKLEKEVIRVLKKIPGMIPGKQRGRPVEVRYALPIVFNIDDSGKFSTPIVTVSSYDPSNPPFKKYSGDLTLKDRPVDAEYISELKKAKTLQEAYQLYLKQRSNYKEVPAYFVDVSNYFKNTYNDILYSSRILSNIPEIDFDNYELLKVYGYQLQVNEQYGLASFIFKRILDIRSEDSQSYRDLALAYKNEGKCQEALDLLNSIVTGEIYKNSERRVFKGIADIAKNEIKSLIKEYKNDLNLSDVDKELLEPVDFDIRITTDWNHNDTDIDLHIIDPNLEECYYKHSKTSIGGKISQDMTQGFGPEEFTLRNAKKGAYYVKVKYYGDRYQKVESPTFMKVTIFKKYGTKKVIKETKIIRLTKQDDEEIVAMVRF